MPRNCQNLLLGITGSVGATSIHDYVMKLNEFFAENIDIMLSRSAQKFTSPYTLELYSKRPVYTDDFEIKEGVYVPHIELAQRADLMLILPATANIIGKAAGGIADDLISTTIIACQAPIVFAPNMNEAMWLDKIVQRNVQILKDVGYLVIEPSEGYEISNMKKGKGGMPAIDRLLLSLELVIASVDRQ